jgi:hypothetical protein
VRPALTVLAGIVVLAVAGCGGAGGGSDSASPPSAQDESPSVRDLETLEPLKQDFNADTGRSRLLLILSPT